MFGRDCLRVSAIECLAATAGTSQARGTIGTLDVACHRLALLVPSGGVVLVEVRPGGPPPSPLRQGAQAVTVYAGGQSACAVQFCIGLLM